MSSSVSATPMDISNHNPKDVLDATPSLEESENTESSNNNASSKSEEKDGEEDVEEEEEFCDDDEDEYEYEDDDFVGGIGATASSLIDNPTAVVAASLKEEDGSNSGWVEPTTKLARRVYDKANTETTGTKRRLMQDLFKIMNKNETNGKSHGYSLEPTSEDSMKNWTLKLLKVDCDSDLHKDMVVLGVPYIHLEMSFPDQYPFEPPMVKVVRPRFYPMTGFVNGGALCMELLTKQGWNPINDISSVILSIQAALTVGKGRLHAAYDLWETKGHEYNTKLKSAMEEKDKKSSKNGNNDEEFDESFWKSAGGGYSESEVRAGYQRLSTFHERQGWDPNFGGAKNG